MKIKQPATIFILLLLLYTACTPYKKIPYFQDLPPTGTTSESITNFAPLTAQSGDLLGINVSSLNHEADMIFNYNLNPQTSKTDLDRAAQTTVVGYLVDAAGNIRLPTIGGVKVAGLSMEEITALLETKLQVYLSAPAVTVRILNFKISVLGDVKSPGSFNVQTEKITLTQALSFAGDLNTTGLRENVLIVREQDGKRQYIRMDLTSKATFQSPYYYLKNNDVVYVQPNRAKNSDVAFQRIGVILSALSIVTYLLTR